MKRILILLALFLFAASLLAATSKVSLAQTDTTSTTEVSTPAPPTDEVKPDQTKPPGEKPATTQVVTPTPSPTPTSALVAGVEEVFDRKPLFTYEGPITRWVSDFAARTGLDVVKILGLTVEDWINLGLSVLIFFLIYLSGNWVIHQGLKRILKRTEIESVEAFLDQISPQISWYVITFALQISLARLSFLSSGFRVFLNQAFFVAYLTITTAFFWKLVISVTHILLRRGRSEEEIKRLRPVFMVIRRISEGLLLIAYFSIMLSYFGIDITAFAAALGIGGLAISLAAQDTLADAIAGFLILLDQPFRVGDRIEIAGLGTWGDVVEIGTRSTRIRTRDNRLVIVPNSAIAKDQIVNYTYPDPRYRVQIEIGIDYKSNLKLARETAIQAVRSVDGVLADKPIDALFVDFGESTIVFRIRWWIDSYIDTRRMFDKVNEALLNAFQEANIKMPNTTFDIHLKVDEQDVKHFNEAVDPAPQKGESNDPAAE